MKQLYEFISLLNRTPFQCAVTVSGGYKVPKNDIFLFIIRVMTILIMKYGSKK